MLPTITTTHHPATDLSFLLLSAPRAPGALFTVDGRILGAREDKAGYVGSRG
jgi:hypothetical protein